MHGKDSNNDWFNLQSIPAGQLIAVKTNSGKSLKGQFHRITDSALEMRVNGKDVDLPSTEVSRVYILRGSRTVKGLLIGAAVGTSAGAGFGAIAGNSSNKRFDVISQGAATAGGAILGLLVGGITGSLVGLSRHKKELVYETSQVR
jgi:hypothetical protein